MSNKKNAGSNKDGELMQLLQIVAYNIINMKIVESPQFRYLEIILVGSHLNVTSKWFWPQNASNDGGQILRLKTFHQDIWYGMTRKSLVPTTTTLYH